MEISHERWTSAKPIFANPSVINLAVIEIFNKIETKHKRTQKSITANFFLFPLLHRRVSRYCRRHHHRIDVYGESESEWISVSNK